MARFVKTGTLPFQKSGRVDDLSRGRVKLASVIANVVPAVDLILPAHFREVQDGNGYRRNGLSLNQKKTVWKATGTIGPFRFVVATVPWCDDVSRIIARFEKTGRNGKDGLDDPVTRSVCADFLTDEGFYVESDSVRRGDCGNVIGYWDYGHNVWLMAGETFDASGTKIEIS